jgi:dTMP kinase
LKTGNYVVLDGIDGAGKSSIISEVKRFLPEEDWVFVREPGTTEVGEKIRSILLHETLEPFTEMFLFSAQRYELRKKIVQPLLDRGKSVFSDRSESATFAYQIRGRQLGYLEELYWEIREKYLPCTPHRYILFELDPEVAAERMKKDSKYLDVFEREKVEFFKRVQSGFHEFANRVPGCYFVDASQPLVKVLEDVKKLLP